MGGFQAAPTALVHKRILVHHLLYTKYLERIPRQNSEPMSVERILARLCYRKHKAVAAVHVLASRTLVFRFPPSPLLVFYPLFSTPTDFEVQVVASVLAKSFGKSCVNDCYSFVLAIAQPRQNTLYGHEFTILPRYAFQIFSKKQVMDHHSLVN